MMNGMTYKMSKAKIVNIWLFLIVFLQTLTAHPILQLGETGFYLQWHHIAGILGIASLLLMVKWLRVPKSLFLYLCVYAIILTTAYLPRYGFGSKFLNMIYAFAAYVTVYNLCWKIDRDTIDKIMRLAGLIYACLVAVNTLLNLPEVISCVLGRIVHPIYMKTFIGGGVNLEATYLGFFSMFFLAKKKYLYWVFALVISAGYGSRTGIIVDLLAMLLFLLSRVKKLNVRRLLSAVLALAAGGVVAVVLFRTGIFNGVLSRLRRVGDETGSLQRLRMWAAVPGVLRENPFGCGFGNAIGMVRKYTGINFGESNVHNVYLQYLMELGPLGLLALLGILFHVGISAWHERFCDPVKNLLLLFFASYLFQSIGVEPLFYVMMALFDIQTRRAVRKSGVQPCGDTIPENVA